MPLFFIMIVNQLYKKREYLHWGGINKKSLMIYFENFGAITIIVFLVLFGVVGIFFLLSNMERRIDNDGDIVRIVDREC